ncbi:DUF2961 domain-containing protein [Kribbella soli]|uniref:DUF2961 domain-containing protein n=1 Tax=Kribbella soli TaxID=1124743 RepID=UPI001EDE4550|nr:DUF2961 domain-containing protein [Kribbella soli]
MGDVPSVYFQVDYTLGDELEASTPYFHAQWRHSDGTAALGTDHVILDGVSGRGTYVGTYLALTSLHRYWWGEGEVKFFVDDDDEFPTLCSTGLEDYAGGAWAFLFERQDDIATTAYWYQLAPHAPFPPLPAPHLRHPR